MIDLVNALSYAACTSALLIVMCKYDIGEWHYLYSLQVCSVNLKDLFSFFVQVSGNYTSFHLCFGKQSFWFYRSLVVFHEKIYCVNFSTFYGDLRIILSRAPKDAREKIYKTRATSGLTSILKDLK